LPLLSSSSYVNCYCYWRRCCHSFPVPPMSTVTGPGVAMFSSSSDVCLLLLFHWYSGNPPFKIILSPLSYIFCAEYMILLLRIQRIEFHFSLHFQLGSCSLSQSCQVLVRFSSQFGKTLGTCGKKFGLFATFSLQVFI
jgi:hypothetical protein